MENRTYLKKGVILFDYYKVDSFPIGFGSTWIVYLVENIKTSRKYCLKEYCPLDNKYYRNEDGILFYLPEMSVNERRIEHEKMLMHIEHEFNMQKELEYSQVENSFATDNTNSPFLFQSELLNNSLYGDTCYVLVDTVSGTNLRSIKNETIEKIESLELVKKVFHLVEILQKSNILHLDIKPENMFLSSDGHLFLLDMGSAVKRGVVYSNESVECSGIARYTNLYANTHLISIDEFKDLGQKAIAISKLDFDTDIYAALMVTKDFLNEDDVVKDLFSLYDKKIYVAREYIDCLNGHLTAEYHKIETEASIYIKIKEKFVNNYFEKKYFRFLCPQKDGEVCYPDSDNKNSYIILGNMGTGKTQFLMEKWKYLIEDGETMPLYLDLNMVIPTIENINDTCFKQYHISIMEGYIFHKRLFLLLDNFNAKTNAFEKVASYLSDNNIGYVICSSKNLLFENEIVDLRVNNFDYYEFKDVTLKDLERIFNNYPGIFDSELEHIEDYKYLNTIRKVSVFRKYKRENLYADSSKVRIYDLMIEDAYKQRNEDVKNHDAKVLTNILLPYIASQIVFGNMSYISKDEMHRKNNSTNWGIDNVLYKYLPELVQNNILTMYGFSIKRSIDYLHILRDSLSSKIDDNYKDILKDGDFKSRTDISFDDDINLLLNKNGIKYNYESFEYRFVDKDMFLFYLAKFLVNNFLETDLVDNSWIGLIKWEPAILKWFSFLITSEEWENKRWRIQSNSEARLHNYSIISEGTDYSISKNNKNRCYFNIKDNHFEIIRGERICDINISNKDFNNSVFKDNYYEHFPFYPGEKYYIIDNKIIVNDMFPLQLSLFKNECKLSKKDEMRAGRIVDLICEADLLIVLEERWRNPFNTLEVEYYICVRERDPQEIFTKDFSCRLSGLFEKNRCTFDFTMFPHKLARCGEYVIVGFFDRSAYIKLSQYNVNDYLEKKEAEYLSEYYYKAIYIYNYKNCEDNAYLEEDVKKFDVLHIASNNYLYYLNNKNELWLAQILNNEISVLYSMKHIRDFCIQNDSKTVAIIDDCNNIKIFSWDFSDTRYEITNTITDMVVPKMESFSSRLLLFRDINMIDSIFYMLDTSYASEGIIPFYIDWDNEKISWGMTNVKEEKKLIESVYVKG